jgi:hypothetical protein
MSNGPGLTIERKRAPIGPNPPLVRNGVLSWNRGQPGYNGQQFRTQELAHIGGYHCKELGSRVGVRGQSRTVRSSFSIDSLISGYSSSAEGREPYIKNGRSL